MGTNRKEDVKWRHCSQTLKVSVTLKEFTGQFFCCQMPTELLRWQGYISTLRSTPIWSDLPSATILHLKHSSVMLSENEVAYLESKINVCAPSASSVPFKIEIQLSTATCIFHSTNTVHSLHLFSFLYQYYCWGMSTAYPSTIIIYCTSREIKDYENIVSSMERI